MICNDCSSQNDEAAVTRSTSGGDPVAAHTPRSGRACRCAILLAVLFWPGAALADYKDSYKKGLEMVERGNWAEAARLMREAAAEQPKEGEQIKLYGMRFETYLPQYYLGLALFNAKDCAGAVKAWETSEGQGVVRKASEYKALQKNKGACQERLAAASTKPPAGPDPAAVAQAVQAAEAEIGKADEASRALVPWATDPDLAPLWSQEGALGGNQKQAADLLASARGKLDAGKRKPDPEQLREARDLALRSAQLFGQVRQEATGRREGIRRAAAEKKAAEDARKAAELKTLPVAPTSPGVPSPALPAPPAELVQAARSYFSGQYQDAAQALIRVNYPPGKAAAQALLLRAAARYSLYVVSGQKDEALRQDAESDVRACRKMAPALAPDPRAFSPRFLEFFKRG